MKLFFLATAATAVLLFMNTGCNNPDVPAAAKSTDSAAVRLVTLDPGHFHAALVQKSMSEGIDTVVHVYAPEGPELQAHLDLIKQYNERADQPTHWAEKIYTGNDFLEKMIAEKKGNVIVLAGNNLRKTQYITRSVEAGLNVLSDKPMSITPANFAELEKDFATAEQKKVLLYDIMTERSEITNLLQREFAKMPAIFGKLSTGSEKDPAVVIESVHYFYKFVSGKALTRPSWFFDPAQQGEPIADVGTHLLDLVQWQCFPDTAIDYKNDIVVNAAKLWPTPVTLSQFSAITKKDSFPAFLQPYVTNDSILQTHGNGSINYSLKGVHVKITARWDYKATEGTGDTHYSILKGSLASLEVKQVKEDNYKPTLYIIPKNLNAKYDAALQQAVEKIDAAYPGVIFEKSGNALKVVIPEAMKVGHEAHFAQVMQRYLQYLRKGGMPQWEVPCMIAKYYTAAKALEIANKK